MKAQVAAAVTSLSGDAAAPSASRPPSASQSHARRPTLGPLHHVLAATTGAIISNVFVTPFDVVKTRMQVEAGSQQRSAAAQTAVLSEDRVPHARLRGTVATLRHIAHSDGVTALWRGLTPSLVVALPSTVLYYALYEQLRVSISHMVESPLGAPLLTGALARIVTTSLMTPFEVVKTNMQAHGSVVNGRRIEHGSSLDVTRHVIRDGGGVRALWTGMAPTLLRDVPFSALYWMAYERSTALARAFLSRRRDGAELGGAELFAVNFASGGVCGTAVAFVTTPADVIKTYVQVQRRRCCPDCSIPSITQMIVRERGWRGLMSGALPRMAKVGPYCAIMISVYELFKRTFAELGHLA